ncbi:uncharacterized protein CLBA1 [Leptodactylus fuscus]|uniref:uncharacterized protein CLBA1 n=1 Tax=Leptodactylus fuscus TaxID=238119 RepID=UPI003F4F3800
MKDGNDVITGCSDDGKTLPVPAAMGFVCLEHVPSDSLGLHKDCDTDNSSLEVTNTWGDFETFNEFTPQSEQVLYENGPLDENITSIPNGDGCTDKTDGNAQWNAFNLGNENRHECERIFRLSFPAIAAGDTNEEVKSLQAQLMSSHDENISKLIRSRLWLECDPMWQSSNGVGTKSGFEWQNSKGCKDLMKLLGSTAENSSNDGGKTNDTLMDIQQLYANESTPPAGNKYLIQTKLDVAPGSKNGHIFSYQLVLKKSDVPLPFLTFSGKKNFFSANQLRFNF